MDKPLARRAWIYFGWSTILANVLTWEIIREMHHQTFTWMDWLPEKIGGALFAFIFLFSLVGPLIAAWLVSRWYLLLVVSFLGAYVYMMSLGH